MTFNTVGLSDLILGSQKVTLKVLESAYLTTSDQTTGHHDNRRVSWPPRSILEVVLLVAGLTSCLRVWHEKVKGSLCMSRLQIVYPKTAGGWIASR